MLISVHLKSMSYTVDEANATYESALSALMWVGVLLLLLDMTLAVIMMNGVLIKTIYGRSTMFTLVLCKFVSNFDHLNTILTSNSPHTTFHCYSNNYSCGCALRYVSYLL